MHLDMATKSLEDSSMDVMSYRRRLPHIYMPGYVLFLTFRLAPGQIKVLAEPERHAVLAHLQRMKPGLLMAFVVMPDHVHLLYQMGAEENMVKTMKAMKGSSSRTLHVSFGRHPPVWQDESYDHIIRTESELLETWKYIEHNPVRKELVSAPGEYVWSSAYAACRLHQTGGQECPESGGQECPPHK